MTERYHPSADQVAFADSVGKSLASMLPLSRLHEAQQESSQTWSALCGLGVFGVSAPEDLGGSGLGATEEALIVLELGRRAVAPSVLASLGAAHLRAVDGTLTAPCEARIAAAYRSKEGVIAAEDSDASLVLVRDGGGAGLYGLPRRSALVDGQLWSSRLVRLAELGDPLAVATAKQALRLRLIDAAASAGIARAALEMAVEYAGLRTQFGRAIGTFQAVKHHCANMALAARCAADQVAFAAVAIDDGRQEAALQVEHAFYVAGAAALENCATNIQVHGGIGFSDEADPHHLLKRARVITEVAGGLEAALNRIADYPAVLS